MITPAPNQYSAGPPIVLGHTLSGGSAIHLDDLRPGLVIGRTGSGKTRGVAAPVVTAYPYSAVVVSVKADLLDLTFDDRRQLGPVWVIDPAGVLGERYEVHGFDLASLAGDFEDAIDLSAQLVDAGRAGGIAYEPDYWHGMAATLFAPYLYAGAQAGHGFDRIVDMALSDDEIGARALIQRTDNVLAMRMFESICALDSRVRDSVQATLIGDLRIFNRPSVIAAVIGSDFAVPDLFESQPATLYLTLPAFNAAEIAPLLGLVLTRIIEHAQRRTARGDPLRPLLLLVDEAAQLTAIRRHLVEWSATARGFGVQLMTLWQDLGQLTQRFGAERSTVINNTGAIVLTDSGIDPDSIDYLKRLADSYGLRKADIPKGRRDVIDAMRDAWLVLHGRRLIDFAVNPILGRLLTVEEGVAW